MACFQQLGQAFFGNLRVGIVFDFDNDGVGIAFAGDLVHDRCIRRPKHQRVGIAEVIVVFLHDADDGERAFFEEDGFA